MGAGRTSEPPADAWDICAAYETYIGRWSRLGARAFLAWLDLRPGGRWLDAGCGTGVLSQTILDLVAPELVVGLDSSPGYVCFARQRHQETRARFIVGDLRTLPVSDGTFDAAVSRLVLNFAPEIDQRSAIAELRRVTRPGDVIAAYVWDYGSQGLEARRQREFTAGKRVNLNRAGNLTRIRLCPRSQSLTEVRRLLRSDRAPSSAIRSRPRGRP